MTEPQSFQYLLNILEIITTHLFTTAPAVLLLKNSTPTTILFGGIQYNTLVSGQYFVK